MLTATFSSFRLSALRRAYAKTAGKETQFARLSRLEQHLDQLPPPQPSDRISAFDEYAKARAEVERLRTEIAQAGEAIIAAVAPKSIQQRLPQSLPVVSLAEIKKSAEDGWLYGRGASAPDFVLVLRRLEDAPLPAIAGGGK